MSPGGVLAVFAHPDDESLLAGGTLAACAQAGLEVGLVSLTRGELGPIAGLALGTGGDLGAVRTAELAAAGRALGATWTECLQFPDGSLEWTPGKAVREAVVERIDRHAPGAVLTFAPEGLYWHPDHRAAHRFVAEAVAGVARPPRLYGATWPAGLAARLATELQALGLPHGLWGLDAEAFGVDERSIDTVLDVGAHVPAKLAALRAHRSQLGPDNLLSSVPDELAARVLGREYFVDLRPGGGSRDWLSEMAKLPTSGARGGLLA